MLSQRRDCGSRKLRMVYMKMRSLQCEPQHALGVFINEHENVKMPSQYAAYFTIIPFPCKCCTYLLYKVKNLNQPLYLSAIYNADGASNNQLSICGQKKGIFLFLKKSFVTYVGVGESRFSQKYTC